MYRRLLICVRPEKIRRPSLLETVLRVRLAMDRVTLRPLEGFQLIGNLSNKPYDPIRNN